VCELAEPRAVRRGAAFAEAVYEGSVELEGALARRVATVEEVLRRWSEGEIPVLVDPRAACLAGLRPAVLVDCRMLKRNPDTQLDQAPVVIALGPGFRAGIDVDAVVETQRGPDLGRVLLHGRAQADTGVPAAVGGHSADRVLRAPRAGRTAGLAAIGDKLKRGQPVVTVAGETVTAPFDGVLRGLLHDGLQVRRHEKLGDVDARNDPRLCWTVSDKAWSVAGGVLEAALSLWPGRVQGNRSPRH
jgi:xanthine dehydrogenase accessory factor